tara:strand:+ start:67 stop:252 length:186 start_codon:yes stop_codon:yes gene_type:complete
MSMSLYSREMREAIEEMIEEHVENCRNKPPVDGEHTLLVKRIIKFLRYGKPKKLNKYENNA